MIANIQSALATEIEKFHFTLGNGDKVWAPYLGNRNFSQDNKVIRGLGKSSPQEILESITYIEANFEGIKPEDIRRKLIDGSLPLEHMNYKGIDCSGFVFYVFDALYRTTYGVGLDAILSVPKQDVLNGAMNFEEWKAVYSISEEEAQALPEDVSMSWVVDTFKRRPVNLCRVLSLVSDHSSNKVNGTPEVGDLVYMRIPDDPVPHVGIIVELGVDRLDVVHSGRSNPEDTGGVCTETVPYSGIVVDTMAMDKPREFLGVRRLKTPDEVQ
jgi:hypothetical protein